MLKELFDSVMIAGQHSAGIVTGVIPGAPSYLHYKRDKLGEIVEAEASPFPRTHVVGSFESFVRACRMKMYDSDSLDGPLVEVPTPRTVWYSRKGLVSVLDDRTRRDTVKWNLSPSKEILTLQNCLNCAPMSQEDFVRLVRIELNYSKQSISNLLSVLRNLQFKSEATSSGVVNHGKRSVGAKEEQRVWGDVEVPEEVDVVVPAFAETSSYLCKVPCAVEINTVTHKFRLTPYPGSIDRALLSGEIDLGIDLDAALNSAAVLEPGAVAVEGAAKTIIPVFLGSP